MRLDVYPNAEEVRLLPISRSSRLLCLLVSASVKQSTEMVSSVKKHREMVDTHHKIARAMEQQLALKIHARQMPAGSMTTSAGDDDVSDWRASPTDALMTPHGLAKQDHSVDEADTEPSHHAKYRPSSALPDSADSGGFHYLHAYLGGIVSLALVSSTLLLMFGSVGSRVHESSHVANCSRCLSRYAYLPAIIAALMVRLPALQWWFPLPWCS